MPGKNGGAADLHRRAERRVREEGEPWKSAVVPVPYDDVRRVVREIRTYQVELEIRSEDLVRVQAKLNASLASYLDLYNLAPVAYFTIGEGAMILEANATAAKLLREERPALENQPFTHFVLPSSRTTYRRCLGERLQEEGNRQTFELMMRRSDGSAFPGLLVATRARDGNGRAVIRVVVTDITELAGSEAWGLSLEHRPRRVHLEHDRPRDCRDPVV